MLPISSLITHLNTATGYPVIRVKALQQPLMEFADLPQLLVGQRMIEPIAQVGTDATSVNHQLYLSDLRQYLEVHIICAVADIETVWNTVFSACAGWHNDAQEGRFRGMAYHEGGVMGLENSRMHWVDTWSIQFPIVAN